MIELTVSQCSDAGVNGKNGPPVIKVQTPSRCSRNPSKERRHQQKRNHRQRKGDKLSDS